MVEYRIQGGQRINGDVRVNGSKNAMLPIFAACILNGTKNVLHNCPKVLDTMISMQILEHLGCTVTTEGNTVIVDSSTANNWHVPDEFTRQLRSSVLFMGSLIGRFGKAVVSFPGGCSLGSRPIDMHIKALAQMGTDIHTGDTLQCSAEKLRGLRIHLSFPSIGATENIMLAAVLAEGETTILNAAREPEIIDLQSFLNSMGADIRGAGNDIIIIRGVKKLRSAEHCIMPDRIEAGTYLLAAAMTSGGVALSDVRPQDMLSVTSKLMEMGCNVTETASTVVLKAPSRLNRILSLETYPYPGFPTDLQAPFTAALSVADGTSIVVENVFSSRYGHVSGLLQMGADIKVTQDVRSLIIQGIERLKGTVVEATDLRCGVALILAGLIADGETVVTNGHHIERGYEQIENVLCSLNANVSKIER